MKMLTFSKVPVLLAFVLVLQPARTFKMNEVCQKIAMDMMEEQLKNVKDCIISLNYNTGRERSDGYHCIMKCMLTKAGIFTPEGKMTLLNGIIAMMRMFPNDYIERAFTEIMTCQEFAGQELYDPNDKYCNKYGPMLKCGIEFMLNICKAE